MTSRLLVSIAAWAVIGLLKAAWHPAAFLDLLCATRQLALVLGLFFLKAGFGTLLDLDLRNGHGRQSCLATSNFLRQVHAVRHRRLVGPLGHRQQGLDICLELDFQLFTVPVLQGAVARGIRLDLGAVQTDRAQLQEFHFTRHLQHLHEQAG